MHAQSDNSLTYALASSLSTENLADILMWMLPILAIPVAIVGAQAIYRMFRATIGYTPSSYTSSEAMRQLPKSSSPYYQRQMTASRNGNSITLRIPTGCQCAMCNPNAEQKALVAGMLAAPPLHEWRGWAEYADR